MRTTVSIKRSGGLANISRTTTVDSATLDRDKAEKLISQIAAVERECETHASLGLRRGADRLHYEITVEANGNHQVFHADEGAMPDAIHQLIAYVRELKQAE